MEIKDYIKEAHETAVSKGWWDSVLDSGIPERSFGDQIALMHSELSEALEEFRSDQLFSDIYFTAKDTGKILGHFENGEEAKIYQHKPEGIAVELADVLIRIFDTCGRYNIPLEEALRLKLDYNKTRPHRHGGKKL